MVNNRSVIIIVCHTTNEYLICTCVYLNHISTLVCSSFQVSVPRVILDAIIFSGCLGIFLSVLFYEKYVRK